MTKAGDKILDGLREMQAHVRASTTPSNVEERARLMERLLPYLKHQQGCAFQRFEKRDNVCRCGLEDAYVAALNSPSVQIDDLGQLLLAATIRVHTEVSEFGNTHIVELAFGEREEADRLYEHLSSPPSDIGGN